MRINRDFAEGLVLIQCESALGLQVQEVDEFRDCVVTLVCVVLFELVEAACLEGVVLQDCFPGQDI